jgi:hypothetical protein
MAKKRSTKRLIACLLIILVSLLIALPMSGSRVQAFSPGGSANASFENKCQEILSRAMDAVQSSCDNLGRNKACYGNNRVKVEPNGNVSLKFDAVGDQAAIQAIHTLITSPLDEDAGTWGLALLKLQANLPDTMPGQNITFLVFGDTSIENIAGNMNAFYFTSGLSNLNCKAAPRDGILVRSPQHTEVSFSVNGVQVTIASTVLLTAERNKSMSVGLVEGHARIATNGGAQALQPGQMTSVTLGGSNGLTAVSAPSAPAAMPIDASLVPVLEAADKVGDKAAPINISLDGCIKAVQGNMITIADYQIDISGYPALKTAKVGDCIHVDGTLTLRNGKLVLVLRKAGGNDHPTGIANDSGGTSDGGTVQDDPGNGGMGNDGGMGDHGGDDHDPGKDGKGK